MKTQKNPLTNFAIVAANHPDAYKVSIAMHAARMKERYRQERLNALGEPDDNPFDERKTYNAILAYMYEHERHIINP